MKDNNVTKGLLYLIKDFAELEKGMEGVGNPVDTYTPSKALVTSFIIGRERTLASCQSLKADITSRLRYRVKNFDGSEVENSKIEKDNDLLDSLDTQEDLISHQLETALDFFQKTFEHAYRPYSPPQSEDKVIAKNKQTNAYKQAMARLNN